MLIYIWLSVIQLAEAWPPVDPKAYEEGLKEAEGTV